ncbi:MAG: DUF4115 domain-containing protein [Ignavibacteriae bacterium]|nr:DUF4115 domain-containing protein [Ignavibacteriota bacterium]
MLEFGASLRKAREASGVTLDEIYEQTRINMRHLRAIEAGDFPSVPQTYVRAFIREYARMVGLDEEETLQHYNDEAEREKGIPKPPDVLDNSNILPHLDDTIEIITPGSVTPRHVEVQGRAEVETQEPFVAPVRVSEAAQGAASVVDISNTAAKSPETTPVLSPTKPPAEKSAPEQTPPPATESSDPSADVTVIPPPSSAGPPKQSESSSAEHEKTPDATIPASRSHASQVRDTFSGRETSAAGASLKRPSVYDTKPPIPGEATPRPQKAEPTPATKTKTTPVTAAPPKAGTDVSTRGAALTGIAILIALLAIASYFYFRTDVSDTSSQMDSTAIKESLQAGRFIDSSLTTMPDPVLPPIDTATIATAPTETRDDERGRVKEDSLVLEAISNAPVWFSVKMDTTRTERGNMSSNEHRVWRARDRFVLTLGDAGAITFFLNGKQLPALGDEGAVIKNVTISRRNLSAPD